MFLMFFIFVHTEKTGFFMPEKIQKASLYDDLAWLWPIVSPPEDYVPESKVMSSLIKNNAARPVKTLLHLGCGGGHNDHTFRQYFDVTGIDKSPAMLSLARSLNPDVRYIRGDMRSIRLKEVYDAVVILDSINHILTPDDLRSCFVTAHEHLKPGGILLTIIEKEKDDFRQNETMVSSNERDGVHVSLVENYYDPDPLDTTYEGTLLFFIRRTGEDLTIAVDHFLCGIFKRDTWISMLKGTGFTLRRFNKEEVDIKELKDVSILLSAKPE